VTIHALVVATPAQLARATIAQHSKSFALASRLLDAQTRDHTAVVYAWCRRADDAIDGDLQRDAVDQVQILRRLEDELAAAYAGRAPDPVLDAFGAVARERAIPRSYPRELLAGMEMDVAGTRYITLRELELYCWRVAGVVGLMMTHVFGIDDDAALVHAAHLGMGMQLTNICRDVEEDWHRGRLYVPDELLARHGAGGLAAELAGAPRDIPAAARAPLAASVRELLAIADRYYASGDRGLRALPWRAAIAVKAASNVYRAIGTEILARGCDVTAGRAVVSKFRKLRGVLAAALRVTVTRSARRARTPARTLELADVPQP
jgi:phytoene synthase